MYRELVEVALQDDLLQARRKLLSLGPGIVILVRTTITRIACNMTSQYGTPFRFLPQKAPNSPGQRPTMAYMWPRPTWRNPPCSAQHSRSRIPGGLSPANSAVNCLLTSNSLTSRKGKRSKSGRSATIYPCRCGPAGEANYYHTKLQAFQFRDLQPWLTLHMGNGGGESVWQPPGPGKR